MSVGIHSSLYEYWTNADRLGSACKFAWLGELCSMEIRDLVVTVAFAAGCAHSAPLLLAPYRNACPPAPIAAPPAPVSSKRIMVGEGNRAQASGYATLIVDGQAAILNWTTPGSPFMKRLGPDVDANDIASVEVVKAPEAQKRFGACPGVPVILITMKSHSWRPYSGL